MAQLVDFSQIVIGSYMTAAKYASTDMDVIRSAVLNTLRLYRIKFSNEYGELVLCCDDRHNWRKEIFLITKHPERNLKSLPALIGKTYIIA